MTEQSRSAEPTRGGFIIRRLALRDFGRFAEFEARFARGLNVIYGNNEAGKSTLREAISLAFFASPRTIVQKTLAHQRWGASERFAIEIDFVAGDTEYQLSKDFQSRLGQLTSSPASGNAPICLTDARQIDAKVSQLLGIASQKAFESTVRICQRDITRLDDGEGIADRLQSQVTGGEEDVLASEAIAQLEQAGRALRSSSRARPGPLVALPARIASLQAELAGSEAELAQAEHNRARLAKAQDQLALVQAERDRLAALVAATEMSLSLEAALKEAEAAESALDSRLEPAKLAVESVVRASTDLAGFRLVLGVTSDEVAVLFGSDLPALSGQSALPSPLATSPARPTSSRGWIAAGTLVALLGLFGGLAYPPLFVLLLAGTLLAGYGLLMRQPGSASSSDATAEARRLAEEAERRQEAARATTAQEAAERRSAKLAELGCESVTQLRERRARGEALERRLLESQARLDGLLAGQSLEELTEERRRAGRRARDLRDRLAEPEIRLASRDHSTYLSNRSQRDVEARRAAVLLEETQQLTGALGARVADSARVHRIEEQIAELEASLAAAQERAQVLALAQEILSEARQATLVSAQQVLEDELGQLVAEITGGRYREVRVDARQLAISLVSPERAEPVLVSLEGGLSTGTVEQVYLAARIALSRLLAGEQRPPFILDDPFVSFDAERTRAVLGLCRRLAADNQMLLFTCNPSYREQADATIDLPAVAGAIVLR